MIIYKSAQKTAYRAEQVLETSEKDGIKCVWSGCTTGRLVKYSWKFDWDELRNQGINHITGKITISSPNGYYATQNMAVDIGEDCDVVTKSFSMQDVYEQCIGVFEYSLTLYYGPTKKSYDDMFAPSEINDVVLVVEGKKLHVNKTFLSTHSEFFRALFSANFKEGQMNEIPIEEVSYDDFVLLMSTIVPLCTFPSDKTALKLLELADRFLMPSVVHRVQNHLFNSSKMSICEKLWLADKYGMRNLLEKSIYDMDSVGKVKKVKTDEKYNSISDATKLKMFDRLAELC